jgi:hypothetical protein
MSHNIVTFPGLSPKRQRSNPISSEPREDEDAANSRADWRSRERIREDMAFQEMQYRGRALVIVMPTEHKALVDLLLYLEKNFGVLPQEWPVAGIRLVVANHAPQPP